MNQAEVLCHSSGPWKHHKYFQKIGSGANAVYKYVKNADKTITGSAYKKEAADEKERAEIANQFSKRRGVKAPMVGVNVDDPGFGKIKFGNADQWARSEEAHGRKAAEAMSKYYTKSLFGKTERATQDTIAKGAKALKDFFNPPAKVTSTHTFFEGKGSTSNKTKTNPDGSKVTVSTTIYPRKKK